MKTILRRGSLSKFFVFKNGKSKIQQDMTFNQFKNLKQNIIYEIDISDNESLALNDLTK